MQVITTKVKELNSNIQTILNSDETQTYLLVETVQLINELKERLWNEIESRRLKQNNISA